MALAPEQAGIGIRRHFTTEGVHPYDEVTWERRDARITNFQDGSVAFEQLGVEFPTTWSVNATNIVSQKYFRGTPGTAERESSLRQVIDRVADTITQWGVEGGYFVDDREADTYNAELKHLLVTQKAAFNSPVWFNIGVPGVPQQASACFILSVDDQMDSILNWYVEEGTIFKGGSGSGINLSRIRSSAELLKGGGTASGPVSFMRGADASAGTIKSGGKTRRAAKMVILNVDHPDVEDFIWVKAREEKKIRVLEEAGFDMSLDGKDMASVQYQNANNSVRVTDEFMQAVVDDADWQLRAVTSGEVVRTIKARDLMRQISQAAWECADPGMQFDTTINHWHTAANTGRINGSNPCCFAGETLVETSDGPVSFEMLWKQHEAGDHLPTVVSFDASSGVHVPHHIERVWVSGQTRHLVRVRTQAGLSMRCTPEHRFLITDGTYVPAAGLAIGATLQSPYGPDSVISVDPVELDRSIPVYDMEVASTHNFAVIGDHDVAGAVTVHNSEYMHLDNSACNLASINLLKFLDLSDDVGAGTTDSFDVEGYRHAIEIMFTGQEILVGRADYPTAAIGETSRQFRQLGLGYANLGAMLMALGLPYDSEEGRAHAAAVTSLMTGHAYATSARTAARMGAFAGFDANQEHMLRVLRQHQEAAAQIDEELVPAHLLSAAQECWDEANELAATSGVRNSQSSVLAPTGCLVGGSLIATSKGLVRLRSLGDPDGAQWQDTAFDVLTDAGAQSATKFYVNGLEQVVDVRTQRGYGISGTTKHRVKVVDATTGEWVWRRFADLRPGDLVPLALGQQVGDSNEMTLPPIEEKMAWAGEHHVTVPRSVTPDLAELVGYFMGDGSLHARGLRFCVDQHDLDVIDHLERLAKGLFGIEARMTPCQGYVSVELHSVRLAEWWRASGFAKGRPAEGHQGKGYVPHIPDALLHTNDPETYRAFLRGLFEADGTVTAGYPSWTSAKSSFADEIQTLMLTLGFVTTRSHHVSGRGSDLNVVRLLNRSVNARWLDEIGFISARKAAKVDVNDAPQSGRYDHLPVSRALLDRVAPVNDANRKAALLEHSRSGTITRRLAERLLAVTPDRELAHLLGFFFDRVATAELGDEELTYDLSVPANVTYVANGFISHNTIGLMMDCDTTGIEPDLGLCKVKKLVGGGTMQIVNQTVPRALARLGYTTEQAGEIIAYIDEHKSILGAPHLAPEHVPVFACSMGDNPIHYSGHVKMMAAVQPFISGAISKTVNMPEEATVEEVEQLHVDAWRMGVKAIAIYRDNCKVAQPLSTAKKTAVKEELSEGLVAAGAEPAVVERIVEKVVEKVIKVPTREKLPRNRMSRTFEFRVADCKGFVTVGEFADGRPGEIFLRISKQGSTLAGIMDAFAMSVSYGLQYGVPLRVYVESLTNTRFEPAGMTDDPDLRIASSIFDYIFRRLAIDYLSFEERAELNILTTGERTQPTLPGVEETVTETRQGGDIASDPPSFDASSPLLSASDAPKEPSLLERAGVTDPAPARPSAAIAPKRTHADAPYCMQCGVQMQRAGSCHACPSCGSTSGCS